MNRKEKRGVSNSTKDVKTTIGHKRIFMSNRGTGNNKGHVSRNPIKSVAAVPSFKLSPIAQANLAVVQRYMSADSTYIKPIEFEGNGKIVEVIKSENDVFAKTGDEAVKYTFKDSKTNTVRTWTTSAKSAISAITSVLMQNHTLMRIWSTGVGQDKRYYAEPIIGKGGAADSNTETKPKKMKKAKGKGNNKR